MLLLRFVLPVLFIVVRLRFGDTVEMTDLSPYFINPSMPGNSGINSSEGVRSENMRN